MRCGELKAPLMNLYMFKKSFDTLLHQNITCYCPCLFFINYKKNFIEIKKIKEKFIFYVFYFDFIFLKK